MPVQRTAGKSLLFIGAAQEIRRGLAMKTRSKPGRGLPPRPRVAQGWNLFASRLYDCARPCMDDEFLDKQTLAGNHEAFRLVVLRYQRPLFRFLGFLGFRGARAEDVAQ